MADADAEQKRAARHSFANGIVDTRFAQPLHRRDKRADAGKDELRGVRDLVRVASDVQLRARCAQRTGDVRGVGDRRVDQGDVQIIPFVLGTSAPTTSFAARTATAKALKIASAA